MARSTGSSGIRFGTPPLRDEDDWIKSITWSGSEAPDCSFIKFDLIVTLPKLTGMQQIKIWQTYSDGGTVGWVEGRTEEGVENPAAGSHAHGGH